MTDDPDIRMAQSIIDYVFRRLALDYLSFDERSELGIYTAAERARYVATGSYVDEVRDDSEEIESEALRNDAGDRVNTDVFSKNPAKAVDEISSIKPAPASAHTSAELLESIMGSTVDAPLCFTCGTKMRPSGSCYVCEGCGSTSGCS